MFGMHWLGTAPPDLLGFKFKTFLIIAFSCGIRSEDRKMPRYAYSDLQT